MKTHSIRSQPNHRNKSICDFVHCARHSSQTFLQTQNKSLLAVCPLFPIIAIQKLNESHVINPFLAKQMRSSYEIIEINVNAIFESLNRLYFCINFKLLTGLNWSMQGLLPQAF